MASIGVIQASLVLIVPTLPTFLILREKLPGALVFLFTPLPAVVFAGGLMFLYVQVSSAVDAAKIPDGGAWLVATLLAAAWALAALMTAIMMAVAAVVARSGKSGGQRP